MKEILEKAIQKAIEGGWDPTMLLTKREELTLRGDELPEDPVKGFLQYDHNKYIWRHDFAKALWGEEWPKIDLTNGQEVPYEDTYIIGALIPYWQANLQQMVIAPDPIEYLKENM